MLAHPIARAILLVVALWLIGLVIFGILGGAWGLGHGE
jgi:hypothetical protein